MVQPVKYCSTCYQNKMISSLSIQYGCHSSALKGGVSVDCITDLDENQSCLLEALQLPSLPAEAAGNRKKRHDKKLSLNPIYRQVPRVVDLCCQYLEKYGI